MSLFTRPIRSPCRHDILCAARWSFLSVVFTDFSQSDYSRSVRQTMVVAEHTSHGCVHRLRSLMLRPVHGTHSFHFSGWLISTDHFPYTGLIPFVFQVYVGWPLQSEFVLHPDHGTHSFPIWSQGHVQRMKGCCLKPIFYFVSV